MVLIRYSWAQGKLNHEKNQKKKSRDTVPLRHAGRTLCRVRALLAGGLEFERITAQLIQIHLRLS
jgi:hypothetical protein